MKLDKVLIPLDGSPLAESALDEALELIEGQPTKVMLLRAAEASDLLADPVDSQIAAVREADAYLEAVRRRLTALGVAEVKTLMWYGRPAPSIVEAARAHEPDLIIMTSHGRSGLGRLVLGSVAESVLRGTRTPILLLRDAKASVQRPAGAAGPGWTTSEKEGPCASET